MTFAPTPPSPPRRIRFAEVTQIKRNATNFSSRLTNYTCTPENHKLYEYAQKSPSVQELVSTTEDHGIPYKVYQEAYYSKEADAPDHAKEYGGVLFRTRGGTGLSALDEWDWADKTLVSGLLERKEDPFQLPKIVGIEGWEYNQCPPSRREVRNWLSEDPIQTKPVQRKGTWASQVNHWMSAGFTPLTSIQIEGPTQVWSSSGLGHTPRKKANASAREQQLMSVFSLEVFSMLVFHVTIECCDC